MKTSLDGLENTRYIGERGNERDIGTNDMERILKEVGEGGGYPFEVFEDHVQEDSWCGCSKDKLLGYGLLMLCLLCYQVSAASNQALYRTVPDLQLNIFREVALVILTGSYMIIKQELLFIRREDYFKVIVMTVAQFLSTLLYFAGVSMLPLSFASGFFQGMNMILVSITMKVLFGHKMSLLVKLAFIGSLLGLLLQSQPWEPFTEGFMPGFIEDSNRNNSSTLELASSNIMNITQESSSQKYNTEHIVLIGCILLLTSVIFETLFMVLVGQFLNSVSPSNLTFTSCILQLPLSIILIFYIEQPVLVIKPWAIFLVTIHCVATAVGGFAENISYQLLPLVLITIIESTDTVFSLIPQYTLFYDHLGGRMNAVEVIGSVLIIGSLMLSSISMKNKYAGQVHGGRL